MMADILICSEKATFGQPEITLGIIPGGGGTQRLTGLIGKSRTMDLVLANRKISGKEAGEWGLCARVVPAEESVTDAAVGIAEQIAKFGQVAAIAGKEAVNAGESLVGSSPRTGTLAARISYSANVISPRAPSPGGSPLRAPHLPGSLRHQGPEGGHDRLRREAQAHLVGQLSSFPFIYRRNGSQVARSLKVTKCMRV